MNASAASSPAAVSSAASTAASAATPSVATQEVLSSSNSYSSMAQLKDQQPKLYKLMMQGICENILSDMQYNEQQLETIIKQGEEGSS